MSGTNKYKEHLLYNENERNVKNIDIAFDSHQPFHPYKHFMDPRHLHQTFMDPSHLRHPRTHAPTLPTPPTLFSRVSKSVCFHLAQ